MLRYFKDDVRRYFTQEEEAAGISCFRSIRKILRNEGLWAIFMYRLGRSITRSPNIPLLKSLLKFVYVLIAKPLEIILGVNIHTDAEIGKGLYIGHVGGIWIGPVKMGENCNISQEVAIGIGGQGEFRGIPCIGDRVYIGPGAKVYGKISIGNNVAIGANAVVSKSLPENAVAVGNPARIVSYEGSAGMIDLLEETSVVTNHENRSAECR